MDNPLTKTESYSGKRIKRGLYRTKNGTLINSDVNGSLNILRKEEFVRYDNLFNNYALNYKDEFDLFVISEDEKNKILRESEGKNRIVVYWNIWSNHYSKIMLKKTM